MNCVFLFHFRHKRGVFRRCCIGDRYYRFLVVRWTRAFLCFFWVVNTGICTAFVPKIYGYLLKKSWLEGFSYLVTLYSYTLSCCWFLRYCSGLLLFGEFEPGRSPVQVCYCFELCNTRLCQHMGYWSCLSDLHRNWMNIWINPRYSFLQCSGKCIWEARKGK